MLEDSFFGAFGVAMLIGFLMIYQTPESMVPCYQVAHEWLTSIQGPVLLAWVVVFYFVYVRLLKATDPWGVSK
jgi:hypothetical protein